MADFELVKSGETICNISIGRAIKGAAISIKVSPSVEEMMKALGTGEAVDVASVGHRYWAPLAKSDKLQVYELTAEAAMGILNDGTPYRLDAVGSAILLHDPRGLQGEAVNLSFLRLTGISEGITFVVKGVFQEKDIIRMGERIKSAFRSFYANFMRPVDYHITVSAQAIRPGAVEQSVE